MELGISLQLYQASVAFLVGIGMGFVYDCLKFPRQQTKKRFVGPVFDVLFWLIIAVLIFWQMMGAGQGELRWFMLLINGLGAFLYFCVLSKYVMCILGAICRKIWWVAKMIIHPCRLFMKNLQNIRRKSTESPSHLSKNTVK